MVSPTAISSNPVELKYYSFMIDFDKCIGSCNVLSQKTFVPKEIKYINLNISNMITNKKIKSDNHSTCIYGNNKY